MLAKIIPLTTLLIVASTVLGFGAPIGTSATLDNFGGDDNVGVTGADTFVTKVIWNQQGAAHIQGATVDIKNTDTIAHTYEICVISKESNGSLSDTVGTTSDCASTGSISSSSVGSATITFNSKLKYASLQDTDISIEQTA